MPLVGGPEVRLAECQSKDHVIEHCLICLQNLDEISLSYIHSLGFASCSKIFGVCCRLLNIKDKTQILAWNFDREILPLCVQCLSCMEELLTIYEQLAKIKKSISKIKNETQIKILSSKSKFENIPDCGEKCQRGRRVQSFRDQATKEYQPTVCMKIMKNVVSQEIPNDNHRSSVTLMNTKNDLKLLEVKYESPIQTEMSSNKEIDGNSNSSLINSEECSPDIVISSVCSVMTFETSDNSKENVLPPSPDQGDDFSPGHDFCDDSLSAAENDSSSIEGTEPQRGIIDAVKMRKRKKIAKKVQVSDNVVTDPDFTVDLKEDAESDPEEYIPRSRNSRNTSFESQPVESISEEAEYSTDLTVSESKEITSQSKELVHHPKRGITVSKTSKDRKFSSRGYEYLKRGNKYFCCTCNDGIVYKSRHIIRRHIDKKHIPKAATAKSKDRIKRLDSCTWSYYDMKFTQDKTTGRFVCSLCGTNYKARSTAKNHIKFIHLGEKTESGASAVTSRGIPRKIFYDVDVEEQNIGEGKCKYRNIEFSRDKSNKKWTCGYCGSVYTSKLMVKKHIKYIHGESKNEDGYSLFTVHGNRRKQGNVRRKKLEDGKFLYRGVEYTIKDEEESNLKRFHCLKCDLQSSVTDYGVGHKHIRYTHAEKKFPCLTCGRRFYYRYHAKLHEETHDTEGKFQCDQCGVVTKSNPSLRAHKRNVHDKIRPFLCNYCGKRFFRQKDCNIHIRIHTKENPFHCDFPGCSSSFSIKATLRKHMLTHKEQKI